jgi:hypothetical protein
MGSGPTVGNLQSRWGGDGRESTRGSSMRKMIEAAKTIRFSSGMLTRFVRP